MSPNSRNLHIVTGESEEERYAAIRRIVETLPENMSVRGMFNEPMLPVKRVHQHPVDPSDDKIRLLSSVIRLEPDCLIIEPITTKVELDYFARRADLWDITIIASVDVSLMEAIRHYQDLR